MEVVSTRKMMNVRDGWLGNRRRDVNFHALGGVPIGFDVICQDRVSLRTN